MLILVPGAYLIVLDWVEAIQSLDQLCICYGDTGCSLVEAEINSQGCGHHQLSALRCWTSDPYYDIPLYKLCLLMEMIYLELYYFRKSVLVLTGCHHGFYKHLPLVGVWQSSLSTFLGSPVPRGIDGRYYPGVINHSWWLEGDKLEC